MPGGSFRPLLTAHPLLIMMASQLESLVLNATLDSAPCDGWLYHSLKNLKHPAQSPTHPGVLHKGL